MNQSETAFAIQTLGLTRAFGELVAVHGLTLSVGEGEIFGLVGPDGAGKTTTMRMLAGILDPTEGQAFVTGLDVRKEPEAVKERIGYMSQRFGLYPDLTVMENIDFYAELYGVSKKGRGVQVERLLAFSDLAPFKRRRAGDLSGGMKQKLGLACALVHTPRVLFLDEPTNGVDPVSRRDFWRILYQLLKERVTIFVSTAYLDEAERCNRIGLMHKGSLLAYDTPGGVKALLKGSLLEIRCGECRRSSKVLREASIGSVAVFGDKVHLLVQDAQRGRAAAEAALRAAGAPPFEIRVAEPSLEDVFIAAVGGGAS
jgi:ABC-2 type transport system ATP-binding protein